MRDQQIANLIDRETHRQVEGIELIASENYASDQVMEAQGRVLTNKYAEGLHAVVIMEVAKWSTRWNSWRWIACVVCLEPRWALDAWFYSKLFRQLVF